MHSLPMGPPVKPVRCTGGFPVRVFGRATTHHQSFLALQLVSQETQPLFFCLKGLRTSNAPAESPKCGSMNRKSHGFPKLLGKIMDTVRHPNHNWDKYTKGSRYTLRQGKLHREFYPKHVTSIICYPY